MQQIIKSITEAEAKAAEIKANALERAAAIVAAAEERQAEILKLCEAECKAYREKTLKLAEEDAQKAYEQQITVKRAESAKYCADKLKDTDRAVNDVIRRVKRGNR